MFIRALYTGYPSSMNVPHTLTQSYNVLYQWYTLKFLSSSNVTAAVKASPLRI